MDHLARYNLPNIFQKNCISKRPLFQNFFTFKRAWTPSQIVFDGHLNERSHAQNHQFQGNTNLQFTNQATRQIGGTFRGLFNRFLPRSDNNPDLESGLTGPIREEINCPQDFSGFLSSTEGTEETVSAAPQETDCYIKNCYLR